MRKGDAADLTPILLTPGPGRKFAGLAGGGNGNQKKFAELSTDRSFFRTYTAAGRAGAAIKPRQGRAE